MYLNGYFYIEELEDAQADAHKMCVLKMLLLSNLDRLNATHRYYTFAASHSPDSILSVLIRRSNCFPPIECCKMLCAFDDGV